MPSSASPSAPSNSDGSRAIRLSSHIANQSDVRQFPAELTDISFSVTSRHPLSTITSHSATQNPRNHSPTPPFRIKNRKKFGRLAEKQYLCAAFERKERPGRLAQLVQSICLTSRGSAVRIRQRPRSPFPSSFFSGLFSYVYPETNNDNTTYSLFMPDNNEIVLIRLREAIEAATGRQMRTPQGLQFPVRAHLRQAA